MKALPSPGEIPYRSLYQSWSYEQWHVYVKKAMHGFPWGEHTPPLVFSGKGSDHEHFKKIQEELVNKRWKVEIKSPPQPLARADELVVIMSIRHREDSKSDI